MQHLINPEYHLLFISSLSPWSISCSMVSLLRGSVTMSSDWGDVPWGDGGLRLGATNMASSRAG